MPSLFLCLYLKPPHPPAHSIEFHLPRENSPAHIHLSVLWILLLLLQLLTPILVLNSSPVIFMQISSLSPEGSVHLVYYLPGRLSPTWVLRRVLRQLTDSSKNATWWKWWLTIKSSKSTRCRWHPRRWHPRKVGLLSPQRKSHTCARYSGQEFGGMCVSWSGGWEWGFRHLM